MIEKLHLTGRAKLPLYDWPEFHDETDLLWSLIVEAARQDGLILPAELDHKPSSVSAWMGPDLVFSQLCGSPWYRGFRDQSRYLGTSSFGLPHAKDGHYYSQIVVSKDSDLETVEQLPGRLFTLNDEGSQSGVNCLANLFDLDALLSNSKVSGGHRHSMAMVAGGEADFAAIDANSFRMAEKVMPDIVDALRIVGATPQTPAPIMVISSAQEQSVIDRMKAAVFNGLAQVPEATKSNFGFQGVSDLGEAAYSVYGQS